MRFTKTGCTSFFRLKCLILKNFLLTALICLLAINDIFPQENKQGSSMIPFKTVASPMFGKDIIINSSPEQNQRNVAVCSAYNGWLFSIYTYIDSLSNFPFYAILKSVDNGLTWEVLLDSPIGNADTELKSISIITLGDSESNLKVFFSGVLTYLSAPTGDGFVIRMNGITGALEAQIFTEPYANEIALACNNSYSIINSDSSILGILYSKYSLAADSLIIQSSDDGGITLNHKKIISVTSEKFHKVSLSFGRCPSYPAGNFFALWEEQSSYGVSLGHIYSAHTFPSYYNSFTNPIKLDSINPTDFGRCNNPSIACQFNNVDNDSANMTEIVLFDRYDNSSQKFNIRGYYNLQAINHNHFNNLMVSDSLDNNLQPDIIYNLFDSTFIITYFDSTTLKLPFIKNKFNLKFPNQWNIVSNGYNDSNNISSPFPKIRVGPNLVDGLNVWNGTNSLGKGMSLFDSPSNTWTGQAESSYGIHGININTYPNPCNNELIFEIGLEETINLKIDLFSLEGKYLGSVTNQVYPRGSNKIIANVSALSTGSYYYIVKMENSHAIGKFMIVR
ncbi:MAG TPA: T9SS type A sorting domain-containing protein [Bacteroidales bacterium]|nr:T9SS type A sorting domain-containing protein [Bacteroidales bacterium]